MSFMYKFLFNKSTIIFYSTVAFCLFGWCSFYIAGKLHVFSSKGKGHSWRFLLAMIPLLFATCIAISRTSDYRHHWQGFNYFLLEVILIISTRSFIISSSNLNLINDKCYVGRNIKF